MTTRPSWNDFFMNAAKLAAQNSTCRRRKVGAVAVIDKRIMATGYNGAPSGLDHCIDFNCLREELKIPSGERHELCRAVHAEQNIIIQAARFGISISGSSIYCTHFPCNICAKMLVNVGIKEFIYLDGYPDELSLKVLLEGNIKITNLIS